MDTSRRRLLAGTTALAVVASTSGLAHGNVDLPHGRAGAFRNPPGSPAPGGGFGGWLRFFRRRTVTGGDPVTLPPGHVLAVEAVTAGLRQGGDRITWLGHSSFLLRLGAVTLLTDPFLTDHASPFPPLGPRRFAPPALRPEDLPAVDVILLSHNHYDHLDRQTLKRLSNRERITLVTALGVGRYLGDLGFGQVLELDWHQPATVTGLTVTALPAVHFSKRGLFDRNATLWCGFLIEVPGHRIYFAGDTAYGPMFEEVGSAYAPVDLAMVPIGAYAPRLLMRGSHCTPEEAVAIAGHLRARQLVAMHWGTIRLTDEPPFEPPVRFRTAALAAGYPPEACHVPAIGETIRLA